MCEPHPAAPTTIPTTAEKHDGLSADDEWEVVDSDSSQPQPPVADAPNPMEQETSKDRISFILVGDSVMPGRFAADDAAGAKVAAPPGSSKKSPPPKPRASPPQAPRMPSQPLGVWLNPSGAASPSSIPVAIAETPLVDSAAAPSSAPMPPPQVCPVAAAQRKLEDAPALPGTPPVSPIVAASPPPPSVLLPPMPKPRTVLDLVAVSSLRQDETTARELLMRETKTDFQRFINEWRKERQRLGDAEARASAEADMSMARRLAEQEQRRQAEDLARRRETEERRSAEALLAERRAAEAERAKAQPRRCDCLGASSGLHRATCPLRDP